jgi:hypothetical protein
MAPQSANIPGAPVGGAGAGGPPRRFYAVLGVTADADAAAIRSAYRRLALQHHPDRNHGNVEAAAEKFKDVRKAYDTLSDPTRRATYDRFGDAGLEMNAFAAGALPMMREALTVVAGTVFFLSLCFVVLAAMVAARLDEKNHMSWRVALLGLWGIDAALALLMCLVVRAAIVAACRPKRREDDEARMAGEEEEPEAISPLHAATSIAQIVVFVGGFIAWSALLGMKLDAATPDAMTWVHVFGPLVASNVALLSMLAPGIYRALTVENADLTAAERNALTRRLRVWLNMATFCFNTLLPSVTTMLVAAKIDGHILAERSWYCPFAPLLAVCGFRLWSAVFNAVLTPDDANVGAPDPENPFASPEPTTCCSRVVSAIRIWISQYILLVTGVCLIAQSLDGKAPGRSWGVTLIPFLLLAAILVVFACFLSCMLVAFASAMEQELHGGGGGDGQMENTPPSNDVSPSGDHEPFRASATADGMGIAGGKPAAASLSRHQEQLLASYGATAPSAAAAEDIDA